MKKIQIICILIVSCLLCACGSISSINIEKNSSATIKLSINVPSDVQNRIMQFSSAPYAEIQIDRELISKNLENHGLKVIESSATKTCLYSATLSTNFANLSSLDTELANIIEYKTGKSWASLAIHIGKENAHSLIKLFPFDQDILEALQPPALYDNPVSTFEYRTMLTSLMGTKTIKSMDAMPFMLSVRVPGTITESRGAVISSDKQSASMTCPAIDIVVLEKDIDFFIKWKQ